MSGRYRCMAAAPVAASRTRAILFNDRRHLISRFEDYSRCARPWAERSDGMTSAIIRPAYRTSIALLKPIARSPRLLRGLARARFRVLYVLGEEALSEFRNATVHAFVALTLTPRLGGYTLYLAVYVKPVSRLTKLYMALIDPFRRLVVYPALGRQVQQRWSRACA
jgi:Protein of unknown function (DUF2867)